MTNINQVNIFNNAINSYNKVGINNVQNNVEQNINQVQQNTQIQTLFPNTAKQLAQIFQELAMLNPQQNTAMLKELLNMPKNFELLLLNFITDKTQTNAQTALMLLASSCNLNKLASLLQNSSKDAMSNLYRLVAQFNEINMSLKDEQLSQITKLISFVGASAASDVQTLKTTMLMYLPWLPLTDADAFKLEISKNSPNSFSDSDDSVSVMISTENYGNIQAEIIKTSKDGIKIDANTSESFPQKDLIKLMKDESRKYSININFDFQKNITFNKDNIKESKTQIYMNTSPGINPFLLVISNAFIKNVHEIDSKEKLRELRKEKLKNGKS